MITTISLMSDVTQILHAIDAGDAKAAGELLPLVYEELRKLATHRMSSESPDHTLQSTALVHEAYIRLVGKADPGWQNRGHFFAAAAEAMRRILVENARHRQTLRRGGDRQRVELDAIQAAEPATSDDVLALNDALEKLAAIDARKAELVKLRYFAGLTMGEAAAVLGISPATAHRHWNYARAWLHREIGGPSVD
jgi:RNA polymerase sigma factor (TIGR02999 family)